MRKRARARLWHWREVRRLRLRLGLQLPHDFEFRHRRSEQYLPPAACPPDFGHEISGRGGRAGAGASPAGALPPNTLAIFAFNGLQGVACIKACWRDLAGDCLAGYRTRGEKLRR